MERAPTVIAWSELEAAFCNTVPGFRRYLDVSVGRVVAVQVHIVANITTLQWISAEPGRFIRIVPISSREQHGWMTRFIATIVDPELRATLSHAVEGPGAFQRFKQLLRAAPGERARWLALRAGLLKEHIDAWLLAQDITGREGPAAPPELREASEVMTGEAELRGLALAQLDGLPVDVLPSAIGFLRYLEAKTR